MARYLIILCVVAYTGGYAALRLINVETLPQDGQQYVIFPEKPIALYYAYRPLSYLDAAVTGMRFHIGPHE